MIKILVVEDEKRSRDMLVGRLRKLLGESALVEDAADGNEAVQRAAQVRPQLIFMDVEMPLMNGIEAASAINQLGIETRIVFLTAYDRFDYAVGALRSGGADYLLKPVSESELRDVLQKHVDVQPEEKREISPFEAELTVYIREHYTEDTSLEAVAESMGMSPFYFSRQIKATTGMTFLEYLTSYRIEKAKKRLDSTELSVAEVGRAVGYSDANYFAKVFKRATGYTPTTYRNRS